jgi:hypothetical protein
LIAIPSNDKSLPNSSSNCSSNDNERVSSDIKKKRAVKLKIRKTTFENKLEKILVNMLDKG